MARHRLLTVLGAALVAAGALPTPAHASGLSFNRTPIGGPQGTVINIAGNCDAANGQATLQYQVRSDAIHPPVDEASFTVAENGQFTVQLENPVQPRGFPGDLEVVVRCGGEHGRKPFTVTGAVSTDAPTIFTALGDKACGQAFGPAGDDNRIPCRAHVKGLTSSGTLARTNFYVGDWLGGASVAVGNVDRAGAIEVITGSGPRRPSEFVVSSLEGQALFTGSAYGSFEGGVYVAAGDVNGDGDDEVITGAGPGGGPHVRVFEYNTDGGYSEQLGFFAYSPEFRGGVTVAASDLDGDGDAEIVTGAGPGGGPHVRVFNGEGVAQGGGFYAYAPAFPGGVTVAAGDLNSDGRAEIVTGAGPGGGPHVRVFTGQGVAQGSGFYAYAPEFRSGVYVALGNVDSNAGREIVTGPGEGAHPHVRVFSADGASANGGFYAYDDFAAGTRVAVVD
ncbi:MAG TPA: VCBS repeat-containing protein [Acidimicrobiales bacterium]|nr:VCBS repeat-containing protein [Acidimicrobiales bacterium]